MPVPGSTFDEQTLTVAISGTVSTSVQIDSASELGLIVPSIVSGTVTVQVSNDDSTYYGLVNQAGTAILVFGASTGVFAVSSNEMGACLGFKYVRVVCGAVQTTTARLFKLQRKWVGTTRV